jgi:hypothetical protein
MGIMDDYKVLLFVNFERWRGTVYNRDFSIVINLISQLVEFLKHKWT